MPTVSEKLRSASVAIKAGQIAKSAASYLESDVLRDVTKGNMPCKPQLLSLIKDMREGVLSIASATETIERMADECAELETVTMTRAEFNRRLGVARDEGKRAALAESEADDARSG